MRLPVPLVMTYRLQVLCAELLPPVLFPLADLTGAEIERALLETARASPNIHFFEHHLATDLVTDEHQGVCHCFGVDVLDQRTMTMCRWVLMKVGAGAGRGGRKG